MIPLPNEEEERCFLSNPEVENGIEKQIMFNFRFDLKSGNHLGSSLFIHLY